MKKLILLAILVAISVGLNAQSIKSRPVAAQVSDNNREIRLPEPQNHGGKPLMECLNERKSLREFSDRQLDLQNLSNLLWASYGVNRQDGRRTAPTARNLQDISIYVIMEKGVYMWESTKNLLILVQEGDQRKETGSQSFVSKAQWNIAIVSDLSKFGDIEDPNSLKYSAMSAGYVSENIYLFCASFDLATVARAIFDQQTMKKILHLKETEQVMLVHSVGFRVSDK
jgi:SagB-type dehydrogenase family enzyme